MGYPNIRIERLKVIQKAAEEFYPIYKKYDLEHGELCAVRELLEGKKENDKTE